MVATSPRRTTGKPSVALISQYYPPEPVPLPHEFALRLHQAGWDVRVLTAYPNYPSGEITPGYSNRGLSTELMDGIQVTRTPVYPSHDSAAPRRILNYLSWALSALRGLRAIRHSDVNLVYGSPITAALPALVMRLLRRTPFVIQVQDLWPDSIFQSGFLGRTPRSLTRAAEWVCTEVYKRASTCVVISPGMGDVLASRGVPRQRIRLIYNWTNEDAAVARARSGRLRTQLSIPDSDRIVSYAGNLGAAQALHCWIEAVQGVSNCHLVLIGDGVEKERLERLAGTLGATNVHFIGRVDQFELATLLSDVDAQIVSLADRELFRVTMPSKIQTALAMGAPVLVSVGGDAGATVALAEAGIAVPPGDVQEVRAALEAVADASSDQLRRWSVNARNLYSEKMSQEVGMAKLTQTLASAVRGTA